MASSSAPYNLVYGPFAMPFRPAQNLSRQARARTPRRFARYLIKRVKAVWKVERVAALWIATRSTYRTMPDDVECYGLERDARLYAGPWPIVAHPTCGPWGKLSWRSRQDRQDGIIAMELVHKWGGVVEQPLGSQLFALHGDGRAVERCNQGDYGFAALKPTILYWVEPT